MDRQHRRELKHDKFVDEVGVLTAKARANQRVLLAIGASAVALALIAYGIYFYRANRESQASALLATAIETFESPLVTEGQNNPAAKFKTEAERTAAAETQFKEVQAKFGGTDSSDVAGLYIARISASRGDVATARTMLQQFVDDHPNHFLVGGARYSLYQMRIDNGEAAPVINDLNAEIAKADRGETPVLPVDSLLVLLANAYEVQGDETKSVATYRRLVTEFPESPFALEAQRRVGPA
ncbi:MAG TPA: tetratricopeptide repeat protein [Thermoanaerobaculia bacterium]